MERRVRVLIVGPAATILGGQAIQAQRLLAHLSSEPLVEASFLAVNPELPRPLRPLQRLKYVRTIVNSFWYWKNLLETVPRFDVLHVFSASYWSFLLAPVPALFAAKIFGKKAVLNYRSGEAEDHLRRSFVARGLIRMFDEIVVPSDYLVEVFARFKLPARSIPNIVDFGQFRFRSRIPLRPLFLSNRNLEPMYNVACTLKAFHLIKQAYPEAELDVVGDGRERERLERLARASGLSNIRFHGKVPVDQMSRFYDRADIFLNSPDIDNMPSSILEAHACGLPVASTDAGGIPHIVEHGRTGLLVPRDDHQALAHAALRYLREPQLAVNIADQAYRGTHAYHAQSVGAQWLRTYQDLDKCAESQV